MGVVLHREIIVSASKIAFAPNANTRKHTHTHFLRQQVWCHASDSRYDCRVPTPLLVTVDTFNFWRCLFAFPRFASFWTIFHTSMAIMIIICIYFSARLFIPFLLPDWVRWHFFPLSIFFWCWLWHPLTYCWHCRAHFRTSCFVWSLYPGHDQYGGMSEEMDSGSLFTFKFGSVSPDVFTANRS